MSFRDDVARALERLQKFTHRDCGGTACRVDDGYEERYRCEKCNDDYVPPSAVADALPGRLTGARRAGEEAFRLAIGEKANHRRAWDAFDAAFLDHLMRGDR